MPSTTTPTTTRSHHETVVPFNPTISIELTRTKSHDQHSGIYTHVTPTIESAAPTNAILVENIPPNGGYGWVCTLCIFLINAHTWGINATYGIFLAYYLANSTFPSASRLDYAFIGGLSISMAVLMGPIVNLSLQHLGTRTTLLVGTAIQSIALLAASWAPETGKVWILYLTQGAGFGWGMGFLYIGSATVLPAWFSTRRSLAVGIAASGAGVGGLVYNLAAGAAVESIGLAWTYRLLAACGLIVNGTCSMLVRDRNETVRPSNVALELHWFKRLPFLLLVAWGFLSELGYIVLLYSMPDYAASVGLSVQQGAVVGAMLNLGLGIGRPVVGFYSDTIGRINMAMLMTGACGILCLLVWTFATSYGLLILFSLLAGTTFGTFWATISPVGAEVIEMKKLQSALSMCFISLVPPMTFAEPIALKMQGMFHRSGSEPLGLVSERYLNTQMFVGCMFIAAALCMLVLRSWKIEELHKKKRDGAVSLNLLERTFMVIKV